MKKKILCIDDSLTSLILLEYALSAEGYEIYTAKSVNEAKNIINNHIPDLILLDLSMPEISGYDFLRMRKELNIENVKIFIISAHGSEESIELTKSFGVTDYILKPLRIDELSGKIRNLFESGETDTKI
ncbi:MAG TPA: response regulator, partial [Bacteroidales bacterium]|nr:response regulator [Bacteroidales bacterium]